MNGFFGTGATYAADVNLLVQLAMGVALLVGTLLARRKCYTAHGICQTTVLLLNLAIIAFVMWPSFNLQVMPRLTAHWSKRYYAVAVGHAALGMMAESLGLYIVLVAATNIVPQRLRFKRWRVWMRTELVLWWVVVLTGLATYYWWYIAPFSI